MIKLVLFVHRSKHVIWFSYFPCLCVHYGFSVPSQSSIPLHPSIHLLTLSTVPGLSRCSSLHSTAPSCRDVWRKASGSEMLFLGDSRTPSVMSHVTVRSAEFMAGFRCRKKMKITKLIQIRTAETAALSPASALSYMWFIQNETGGSAPPCLEQYSTVW